MSTTFERPPDDSAATLTTLLASGGLDSSATIDTAVEASALTTLGALPLGAHLILRCRKDWRTATVVRIELEKITLSVSSPTGRTYRMRRPPDAAISFDGHIPLLDASSKPASASAWRAGLAHYDVRW